MTKSAYGEVEYSEPTSLLEKATRGHNIPARLCTGVNRGQVCRQREGCERYRAMVEEDGGRAVSVMPAPSYAYECVYFIPVREVG